MLIIPLMQYDFYIVQPHLFEKLVGFISFNNSYVLPVFKQIVLNYTSSNIKFVNKNNFFRLYMYMYFFERITFNKPIFNFAKNSISDFKINLGQLIGFNSILYKNNMYNFLYQYLHTSMVAERNFIGSSFSKINFINFGSLNILFKSLFSLPMVSDLIDMFEELYVGNESYVNMNFLISNENILCIFFYLTHLQFPLNDLIYYQYY